MWLTRLSIQRPVFVIVLLSTLILLGLVCRNQMQVEERPRVDIPYVTISSVYPGTGPAEMESQVTKPIEDAVSSVNGIRNITSSSQYGISFVQLEFFMGTDSRMSSQEVKQKVDGIRRQLPREMDPPSVDRLDINSSPVLYLGLKGDPSLKQLRFLADTQLRYRLAQVPGVGKVDITGGDVREIRVAVDKRRLEAWNLSISDVVGAIYKANANVPSGHVTEGPRDYDARLVGEFQSVEQMENVDLPVSVSGGNVPLKLRDVATVKDTTAEKTNIARVWTREGPKAPLVGANTVGLTLTKLADANTIEVVDAAMKELHRIEKETPGHLKFQVIQDESTTVRNALADINVSLIFGALLAIIVVFFFLHNLRGTIICAIAIPTSLVAAFIPMYFLGQSLNNMTMLGLSLVVGILVDDSIVVLENIYRHLYKGETPVEAALNGRGEIGQAAIIITLVDVVVFLPMIWMGGIVGQFFRAFGLTVAVATLFSLLVSFTVTPWLASRWYKLNEDLEAKSGFFAWLEKGLHNLDRAYRRALEWVLGTPRWFAIAVCIGLVAWLAHAGIPKNDGDWTWFWIVGVCVVACMVFMAAGWWSTAGRMSVFSLGVLLFAFTMQVFGPLVKIGYIPVYDMSRLGITIELPAGSSLEKTNRLVQQVEKVIAQVPEVKGVFTNIGTIQGGSRGAPETGLNFAQLNLQLYEKPDLIEAISPFTSKEDRERDFRQRTDNDIAAELRKKTAGIPGAKLVVVPLRGFGGISAPVQVELLGFDLDRLKEVALDVRNRLSAMPGVLSSDISLRPGKPEAQVTVDREKAARYGLDVTQIGTALRDAYQGNNDAKYREEGEQFDIRVQFADFDRTHIDDVGSVVVGRVMTDAGPQPVRLNQVATVTMGEGPSKIERKNRLRKATVAAYVAPGVVPIAINQAMEAQLKTMSLGDIKVSAGGDADRARTEYPHLIISLALSFIMVYLLMAVLFDNLIHPFTIQLSLPMAVIGAVLALWKMDQMLSIISITGFIMLGGIVQKNAILLVDFINTLRERGYDRDEAIKEAGPTRLKPILMTTLAMIAGMMPIALAVGRGNEARAPLATTVIGGLVMSTQLTLLIIPCLYSVFDDVQTWAGKLLRKGKRSFLVEQALTDDPTPAE